MLDEDHEAATTALMDTFVLKLEGATDQEVEGFLEGGPGARTPRTSSIFLKTLHPSVTKDRTRQKDKDMKKDSHLKLESLVGMVFWV